MHASATIVIAGEAMPGPSVRGDVPAGGPWCRGALSVDAGQALSANVNTLTDSASFAACVRRLSAAAALSSTSAAFCCVT